LKAFVALVFLVVSAVALVLFYCTKMPGKSPPAITSALSDEEKTGAVNMKETCEQLAHVIGHRSTAKAQNVLAAREYLEQRLGKLGLHSKEKTFSTRGMTGINVEAEIEGSGNRAERVVIGAHYDTDAYCPGGDDNASGCAMLLEVARLLKVNSHDRTIDVVFFDFGSSRFAGSNESGSHAWVEEARRSGKQFALMLSIDSIGRFSEAPGSQGGPFPLSICYPGQGNFVMFAGDIGTRSLVQNCVEQMRTVGGFPCQGITLPGFIPSLDNSDHYAFRQNGTPAIVVTDTGPLRNKDHGTPNDTADQLNYDAMARLSTRLAKVIERLSQAGAVGSNVVN
jgi:Zn-dependent M28 family amino/carboxypeptidase